MAKCLVPKNVNKTIKTCQKLSELKLEFKILIKTNKETNQNYLMASEKCAYKLLNCSN